MTKQVSYEIAIKGVALEVIGHKIDKVGLKVLPYSKQELGNDAYDPNSIICIGYFPDSVAPELIASNMNSLRLLEGVKDVKILSVSESREKRSKMHHFMIPLLISTAVNSLSVFAIILDENMKYIRDFNRLNHETTTTRELYEKMLALYPDRANPGSLWGSAKAAKA